MLFVHVEYPPYPFIVTVELLYLLAYSSEWVGAWFNHVRPKGGDVSVNRWRHVTLTLPIHSSLWCGGIHRPLFTSSFVLVGFVVASLYVSSQLLFSFFVHVSFVPPNKTWFRHHTDLRSSFTSTQLQVGLFSYVRPRPHHTFPVTPDFWPTLHTEVEDCFRRFSFIVLERLTIGGEVGQLTCKTHFW